MYLITTSSPRAHAAVVIIFAVYVNCVIVGAEAAYLNNTPFLYTNNCCTVPEGAEYAGPARVKLVCPAVALKTSSLTRGPVTVIVPPLDPVVSVTLRLLSKLKVTPVPPVVFVVSTAVVLDPAPTPSKPSLSVSPSTSEALTVMFVDVPVRETLVPAVRVTSVPLDEFIVNGDDVPVTDRSVPGPDDAAIVMVLPVSVMAIFAPAAIVTGVDPPVFELMIEVEAVPAPTVKDPSFVSDKSPVLEITVPVTLMPVPAVYVVPLSVAGAQVVPFHFRT